MQSKEKYSLAAHKKRFGTEEQCRDFILENRWQGRPKCYRCGNQEMNYYIRSRSTFKCSSCRRQFSLTHGTIFQSTKLPLTKWFEAIYYISVLKKGLSSVQLGIFLEVKQQTAWSMYHRLRSSLENENNILLSGIVEADETFIGPNIDRDTRLQRERKRHYAQQNKIHGFANDVLKRRRGAPAKRGRKKGVTLEMIRKNKAERLARGKRKPFDKTTAIFGMMEHGGRIVLKKLGHSKSSASRENILKHLKATVSPTSILITDQASLYSEASNMFLKHLTVNHDIGYVIKGIHTNNIENVWMHLKKFINSTPFHISRQHFDRYLDEVTFRWNRRKMSPRQKVDDFLLLAAKDRVAISDHSAQSLAA